MDLLRFLTSLFTKPTRIIEKSQVIPFVDYIIIEVTELKYWG